MPINLITAFIDGSLVYGSNNAVSRALRAGTGGLLRVVDNPDPALGAMLPLVSGVNISKTYMCVRLVMDVRAPYDCYMSVPSIVAL